MATSPTDTTPALETEPGAVPPQQPLEAPPEPEVTSEVVEQASDDLADIEKPIEPRVWVFEGDFTLRRGDVDIPQHFKGEYVQEPLSYIGFLEFTGLLARKIEEAMRGEGGLTIKDIIDTSEGMVPLVVDGDRIESIVQRRDFEGIDAFVQGLMKIASYVPDVIEECQFIWLGVPRRDRSFLREIWRKPRDRGGLSHDEGEEMLSLFIEQNYEELEDFFTVRLPRIAGAASRARKRMMKRRGENNGDSQRSRPWSPTPAPTPSQ